MLAQDFQPDLEKLVADTIELNQIAAPTFDEGRKGNYIRACFEQIGLENVRLDEVGNVIGILPGIENDGEVILAAHLDTVFPHGTDLTVKREKNSLIGPGVGDNNMALAALLATARYFRQAQPQLGRKLVFVATVGEEGLGDLRGIRALIHDYQTAGTKPGAIIAIEGHGMGNICHQGVGSRRMRVVVRGQGGHSWDKAGRPSAIHGLAQIMQRMTEVSVPISPRTSFNIGTIEGGISVNTIAPEATMVFEVRSVDEKVLADTFGEMTNIIRQFRVPGLTVETKVVGNRPAGKIPENSPIVELCTRTYRSLKIEPSYVPFSTDANIPLSLGLPAVCLGISRGGNAHRQDEWIETEPATPGLKALVQITCALVQ